MSCLPTSARSRSSQALRAAAAMGRLLDSRQKRLDAGQRLFARRDAAAERAVRASQHVAKDDHQIVEANHGLAGLGVDHGPFRARGPVAGRAGQHQVARLGIDEHVADAAEPGEDLHGFGRRFARGQTQLDLLFQPRQRDHPQRRIAANVLLAGPRSAGGAGGGQVFGPLLHQRNEHAVRIDPDAHGKGLDGAGTAHLVPTGGMDRGGDQVDERIEVGLGAAALAARGLAPASLPTPARAPARVRSSPISEADWREASRAPARAWARAIWLSQASRCFGSGA